MAMDMPPKVPSMKPVAAQVAAVPECRYLTQSEADVALARLKRNLPSTAFDDNARPSEVCGLVRLQLKRGTVVYTEPTGRYLLLTFALDTHKGEPADTSAELDKAIERREVFPTDAVQGVTPPMIEGK